MEHRLSCHAYGSYPGKTDAEKNIIGHELTFNDEDDHVIDISCSDSTIILIHQSGKSQAFGDNSKGQLGIGSFESTELYTEIKSDQKFITSKCSNYFTFWINDKSQIYMAGGKNKLNQPTLIQGIESKSINVYEKSVLVQVNDKKLIYWPDFDEYEQKYEHEFEDNILEFSCGNNFAISLLENNSLFKIEKDQITPVVIPRIALDGGNRFLSASCSRDYIAVVDLNGGVWVIGKMHTYDGQDAIIPIMDEAEKIVAFPRHCVIFDGLGLCFSFGANEEGQLGNGSQEDCASPFPMEQSDAAFAAIGGDKFTILVPFSYDEVHMMYHEDDIIPGSLAKTIQNSSNFIPQ
ncbi:hypothetical protein TVAG_410290 [Trichomonas vaginalis G3]|uniref:Uncharacterized protein n=1 Tax=Trichomonas vaginalis (strain ATCC PRA-98 / G3) TaxID=412133 RepID=A2E8J2_TRIV3|nr:regulator of chromosome condensation 1/beta-lactamase-inhibitor protein II family [Trichomonas vaginalis G3]EAY11029.1 hypothetical protein TVAG_410290 [Trichomonas vaginalis G3]KAI5531797.1 regulator of chromosome condensation 1/beta-lactamase-inhibitor protein II family [Trichomonas vaginalis G3]|eukprot:XP_001323252.1 hypothetical protein [Trichomonas vaginalis G3]